MITFDFSIGVLKLGVSHYLLFYQSSTLVISVS